jgi:hypothetical protein
MDEHLSAKDADAGGSKPWDGRLPGGGLGLGQHASTSGQGVVSEAGLEAQHGQSPS